MVLVPVLPQSPLMQELNVLGAEAEAITFKSLRAG